MTARAKLEGFLLDAQINAATMHKDALTQFKVSGRGSFTIRHSRATELTSSRLRHIDYMSAATATYVFTDQPTLLKLVMDNINTYDPATEFVMTCWFDDPICLESKVVKCTTITTPEQKAHRGAPSVIGHNPKACMNNTCSATADTELKTYPCAGCRREFYCSKSCQRTAWPRHRQYCLLKDDIATFTTISNHRTCRHDTAKDVVDCYSVPLIITEIPEGKVVPESLAVLRQHLQDGDMIFYKDTLLIGSKGKVYQAVANTRLDGVVITEVTLEFPFEVGDTYQVCTRKQISAHTYITFLEHMRS